MKWSQRYEAKADPLSATEGHGPFFGYPKADHQPASFTVFNITVADIAVAVDHLNSLGVKIERIPGYPADDRGIVQGPGHLIGWFKDPARNVLSVVQMQVA